MVILNNVITNHEIPSWCKPKNKGFQATFSNTLKQKSVNKSYSWFLAETFIQEYHIENVNPMVVHANANTQPGGVQGAIFNVEYQSELVPGLVHNPPIAKPPKLMSKPMIKCLIYCFII